MKIATTEYDNVMDEIMQFTETVVQIADMRSIPAGLRANTILAAEQILHKAIMDRMVVQCVRKTTPCNN